jgi:hypothetical protein
MCVLPCRAARTNRRILFGVRLWPLGTVVLAAMTVAACTSSGTPPTTSQPAPTQPLSSNSSAKVPAWVTGCMRFKRKDRFGPAPAYVGLSFHKAHELATQRRDGLVTVGVGGHCIALYDDLVMHPRVIAVAFDKRGRSGLVIAAERISPSWDG